MASMSRMTLTCGSSCVCDRQRTVSPTDPCDRSAHFELVQHHDHWAHEQSIDGENALESLLHRTKLIVISEMASRRMGVAIPITIPREEMSTGYLNAFQELLQVIWRLDENQRRAHSLC